MLKADWFKNDITHVLIKMVSPLERVGISFFSSCYYSVYNCISCHKILYFLSVIFVSSYSVSVGTNFGFCFIIVQVFEVKKQMRSVSDGVHTTSPAGRQSNGTIMPGVHSDNRGDAVVV